MEIEFTFSGGYGGLFAKHPLGIQLDTEALPDDQRSELLELLRTSGLLEMAPQPTHPGPQRDVFTYSLAIRQDELDKAFTFDDTTAPSTAHPLLAFLRQLAIEQQEKGA